MAAGALECQNILWGHTGLPNALNNHKGPMGPFNQTDGMALSSYHQLFKIHHSMAVDVDLLA